MRAFENPRFLLAVAGVVIVAIVVVIAVARITSGRPSASGTLADPHDRCAIARKALDAYDRGERPPPEWIQDRDATAKAVRDCDRT